MPPGCPGERWVVRLEEIVMIHDLRRQGLSVSAIARKTGLDRKTVRKHLAGGITPPAYKPRPERPRLLEPFEPYLLERITQYPDLSGRRLLREITAMGFKGGYTSVTDFLRVCRPERIKPFERRFETPAGRRAQVDFAQSASSLLMSLGSPGSSGCSRWSWGTADGYGGVSARRRTSRPSCAATSMPLMRWAGRPRRSSTIG
jgi:hypothetical protein